MASDRSTAKADDFTAARRAFELWRKTKTGRERIPKRLWQAAVKLCNKERSVNTVAMSLSVNHTELKKRVDAVRASEAGVQDSAAAFVELALSSPESQAECVLELEGRHGTKLTLRLKGMSAADVVGVSRSLWKQL